MTGSLASVHPELIPEWSEKNLPLTPDKRNSMPGLCGQGGSCRIQ